mmetsp:Transcript_14889/g.22403  ORF Transcript_14889/g.22403 Transcript_14889/m.22403 type:complete len:149 (+) Transcript_14889:54-500(+)
MSDCLYTGDIFLKFGRQGRVQERRIHISKDKTTLYWKSSIFACKKPEDSIINLQTVTRLEQGQNTTNFKRKSAEYGGHVYNQCFSLITPTRSVDLMALSSDQFDTWFNGLAEILQQLHGEEFIVKRIQGDFHGGVYPEARANSLDRNC